MKTTIFFSMLLALMSCTGFAQLSGSGKVVKQTYDYRDFDKVVLQDLDGKVTIEVGKPWSIAVGVDDNLAPLLSVGFDASEHQLTIAFKDNRNNRKYIEDTKLDIRISMPEISVLAQEGNADVSLRNVMGRYLKVKSYSNGNISVAGTVDSLDILHDGNGDVNAASLTVKNAKVSSSGNGNVVVLANDSLTASGSGNGDIVNKGKAAFDKASSKSGNGQLIHKP